MKFVSILYDLMCTTDQVKVMHLTESFRNVWSERVRNASIVHGPSRNLRIGICPQKITKQSKIRNINRTRNLIDFWQRQKLRRESTVHAKDSLCYQGSDWHAVENVHERSPKFHAESSLTFIVETIDTINRSTFMISTKKKYTIWVQYLVSKKKHDSFGALI